MGMEGELVRPYGACKLPRIITTHGEVRQNLIAMGVPAPEHSPRVGRLATQLWPLPSATVYALLMSGGAFLVNGVIQRTRT